MTPKRARATKKAGGPKQPVAKKAMLPTKGGEADFIDDWGPDEDWGSLGWDPEHRDVGNGRESNKEGDTGLVGDEASGEGESRDEASGEDESHDGDRLRDGTDVLQAAAREFISAARTMLDVAEEVVSDPRGLGPALSTLAGMTNDLLRSATHTNPIAHWRTGDVPPDDDPDDGFQRIHVD